VIVAYMNRLCRNGDVKREVVNRIEAVGGEVWAADMGAVSHRTAALRLTSDVVAAMDQFYAEATGERLAGTQADAIAEGIPIGAVGPGYRKDPTTRRLVVHAAEAKVMREAFELRAEGKSWRAVQRHMAAGGIVRSAGSVRKLLHSR